MNQADTNAYIQQIVNPQQALGVAQLASDIAISMVQNPSIMTSVEDAHTICNTSMGMAACILTSMQSVANACQAGDEDDEQHAAH